MSTGPMSLLERLAPVPADGIRAARGRAWFETAGLPDPRAEAWRSTPLDEIVAALGAAGPAPATWEGLDPAVVDDLAGDHGGPRLVFVNGALMLADNIAAIPMIIKFSGITSALANLFKSKAVNNPMKAPMKMLGAKTPPSPPAESVTEVIIGFKIITASNVMKIESVGIIELDVAIFCLMA